MKLALLALLATFGSTAFAEESPCTYSAASAIGGKFLALDPALKVQDSQGYVGKAVFSLENSLREAIFATNLCKLCQWGETGTESNVALSRSGEDVPAAFLNSDGTLSRLGHALFHETNIVTALTCNR